ncbi:MAG: DNA topoisomerase 3 [Defluviitaleaceae bacterium]|nr:DNA topoisomerase 3 [Defluviitaleaceae bacterium]
MRLVIGEKPSVSRAIASIVGAKSKKDGYYEGNGYIVSWCVGHLLGLAPPDAYGEKYAKWRIDDLPILPNPWIYKPNDSTKKQLKTLKELLSRSDVEAVINACDAGREGELIFRLVYNHCKCKKPMQRLWISSMEESAIAEGIKNLRKGTEYDNLHQAALCRQQADWVVGMNYSRLFGCLYNVKGLSIGRVQTPTLAMIVEREDKIKDFTKEPFYTIELVGTGFTAVSERFKDKTQTESIAAKCNGNNAIVKSVTKQEKCTTAPKLYDLTTLQREANRLFDYSASDTLKYAQNLYEQKILTYPRTDSRFITEDMAAGIPALVTSIAASLPFVGNVGIINVLQVVNNKKVTDHHAIIPTAEAGKVNLDSSPAEKNILMMVCARLLAAVSQKQRYAETVITVESMGCVGVDFTAKGKTVIDEGWKVIENAFMTAFGKKSAANDAEQDEKSLPNLTQNHEYPATVNIKEGHTSPPKSFTEDTLLSAMESAGVEDMPEDAERKGIGTPATRAEIIETLLRREYIIRKNKLILPTEKGIGVIKVLPDADSIKSPILTAQWESDLKRVERGELSAAEFITAISNYVSNAVMENKTVPNDKKSLFASVSNGDYNSKPAEILGVCPRCNNDVVDNRDMFSCMNRWCKFALWKDSKFFTAKKKTLTKTIARALITEGRIFIKGLYSSKTDKTYDATIILNHEGEGYPTYSMEYEKKQ